ncbi:hypothetical protein D554_2203 [Bordetella holmesii 30539]|uniref:N-acetyltransferase YedL n=1 Tax=Bordetella holmesii 1058 TaxID=1247648 RepID=A0ABN0S0D9_9BORD|nr:hypothetical protein D560_0494 [Bordetella holmesii ATCC 51541]AIT25177.1 hypothetical protein D558_0488 [Bordetella holmesii 44057]EWM45743.1 hypothetical protein D557_3751 [Bordetella holmesii 70147]EWM48654.1 hypothetical protein D556_0490 [Bordetella holmesii 41130]EXF86950.1 hypothetical protein D554_2203 [Bordetella holmesii 30539]EXX95025.1 hypothetical protein D559_2452 [Bordetella holmesii 1058]KAK98423.1 hypothetical protein L499_A2194 [Bordetella holmesii CDC-H635-BH]
MRHHQCCACNECRSNELQHGYSPDSASRRLVAALVVNEPPVAAMRVFTRWDA